MLSNLTMSGKNLNRSSKFYSVGVTIAKNVNSHIHIAKAAYRKLSSLFRSKCFFIQEDLLTTRKSILQLLVVIKERAIHLIDTPELSAHLPPFTQAQRRRSLPVYRYFYGNCSPKNC